MHKLTNQDYSIMAQFVQNYTDYSNAFATTEPSREDLCQRAHFSALAAYAKNTMAVGYYDVEEQHIYYVTLMHRITPVLHPIVAFQKNFNDRFASQYNGYVPLKARAYLEQQLLDESIDANEKELTKFIHLYAGDPMFAAAIQEAQARIAAARNTVVKHTDPKTGHVFYGRTQNDDKHDALSVGIHNFLMTSEKKS